LDFISFAKEVNIKTKPRLLVLDIDGTIINKNNQISDEDINSINRVVQAGIPVSLCTGRSMCTSLSVLAQLKLDGFHVFFDGALVCNAAAVPLYSHPIPQDYLISMCRSAVRQDLLLDLFTIDKYFVRRKNWRSELRHEYFGIESDTRDFSLIAQQEPIIKGTIAYRDTEDNTQSQLFISEYSSVLDFSWSTIPAYPGCHFVNIIDKGVSKGTALKALANHYSIGMEQIMAIGDGANDISLLSSVGTAVAMGSAPVELKAHADYITEDVERSGVSKIVRELLINV
jgi:Cof subfamily protein (haloacid dehalogenase superfamily)